MALTKRDEAKVGKFDFHAPKPAELYDERSIGMITIFQYGINKAEDGLKRLGTEFKVRFERGQTDKAIKATKSLVKDLNAGEFPERNVYCVPTGRPRGRQKVAA